MAAFFEQARGEPLIDEIVFGEQDAQSTRRRTGVRLRSPAPSSVSAAGSGTPVVETVHVPKVMMPPVSSAPPALL
jgi:hypothetical protein